MNTKTALILSLALIGALSAGAPQAAAADYKVEQRYYGLIEARDFDQFITVQDLSSYRRRTIDLPKLAAEMSIQLNEKSKIEFEIEYEHGGTGSAMEYETNEYGEFETEIEKGGEVVVEELLYERELAPGLNVIVGKAPLFLSFSSLQRKPLMHAATQPFHLEGRMIPREWTEPGVQVRQRLGDFTARLALVAGLNSEFFRTYSWIGGGHQKRFEDVNFDSPAYLASLEWGDVAHGDGLAVSYYTTETTKNRRKKNRITQDTRVDLLNVMGAYRVWRLGLKAELLQGELQNSELISNKQIVAIAGSAGLFNNIGARAVMRAVELDYEFIDGWTAFLRWEHVNTFAKVQGDVFADPRYDVRQTGWGLMHKWDETCAVKFEHHKEWTKLPDMPVLSTYTVQFAFDTGDF